MTLALATLGELPEDGAAWAPARRRPRRRSRTSSRSSPRTRPAFMRNYDMRCALHEDRRPGTGGWIRARAPRALDAPLVAAMTDAWAPVAFAALGAPSSRRRSTSRSTSAARSRRRAWRPRTTCSAASPAASPSAASGRRTASCGARPAS